MAKLNDAKYSMITCPKEKHDYTNGNVGDNEGENSCNKLIHFTW